MTKVALALGGNLGNVKETFNIAVTQLKQNGFKIDKISSFHRTMPIDCPLDTPDFINGALTGDWPESAGSLLELCRRLEITAGRPERHGVNLARTLDVDIILFGDRIICTDDLIIPHPRAATRRFVLEPLFEIAPNWIFPDSGKSVAELFKRCNTI
ncbi:MAG: 2-amino-4-hydroxy-6-hydroxymethyldihydropteridine diphosphokinase [Victivallaceae bacterium]